MTDNPVIILTDVTKRYRLFGNAFAQMLGFMGLKRGGKHKTALSNINLRINKGEKVGIIGRNGSGKTTLLKLIIGHTQVTHGRVEVEGAVQSMMQMGYGFNPDLTGHDNVNYALVLAGMADKERKAALAEIEAFVELGQFFHYPIKTYSLGMLARLEFATATAIRPDILAIDEVLGAGDGYFVKKCADRMQQLIDSTTLLLVSHSLDQISTYCQRVIWLDGGQLIKDGPAPEVIQAYREFMNTDEQAEIVKSPQVASEIHNIEKKAISALAKAKEIFKHDSVTKPPSVKVSCAFEGSGKESLFSETGKDIAVRFAVEFSSGLPLDPVQPALLGMSEHGAFIFEAVGKPVELKASTTFQLLIRAAGIGVGAYFLIPVLRQEDGSVLVFGDRALFLNMQTTNWSDPPLLHMDGQWTRGPDHKPIPSKISAWV